MMFDSRCLLLLLCVLSLKLLLHTVDAESRMTPQERDVAVNKHNELRRLEGASNMLIMTWDQSVATWAQSWADKCRFEHGPTELTSGSLGQGQNIFASTGQLSVDGAVQSWYDEKADFTFDTVACKSGKMCGHYTQVTWASSKAVGCAYKVCDQLLFPSSGQTWQNSALFVCNYSPAGNYVGAQPYRKGPECSQCDSGQFYCNNGLCDDSCKAESVACECKAHCRNCGNATSLCTCSCGVGWAGVDCSKRCVDSNKMCGANPGWPDTWCDKPYVGSACLAMCKTCNPGEPTCQDSHSSPGPSPTFISIWIAHLSTVFLLRLLHTLRH